MRKVLIQLNCSLNISNTVLQKRGHVENNQKRTEQIFRGLEKFFEKTYSDDIIFTDNTVPENEQIDQGIESILKKNNVKINHSWNNRYGSVNKGAGLIEKWIFIKEELKKYDYVLYFEPRLLLLDFSFIDNFLENPRNLFVLGSNKKHFFTGLFGINSSLLLSYIDNFQNPKRFSSMGSIENHLFDFVRKKESYDTLEKANVVWSDFVAKKEV